MKKKRTLPLQHRIPVLVAAAVTSLMSLQAQAGGWFVPHSSFGKAKVVENVNLPPPAAEGCPIESPDGLSLFIASNRPGGVPGNVGNDIWVADRDSIDAPFQAPRNLGEPVNSTASDFCPTPVGRSLFFVSERLDNGTTTPPCGGGDMYLSRQSPAGGWSQPVMLACAPDGPNFSGPERSPSLVETGFGTYLFYSSNGGSGDQDIYVSKLQGNGKFGPGRVVKELSSEYEDIMPNVRQRDDGLFEIVYSSNRPVTVQGQSVNRGQDVYISYALWPTGTWSQPRNLGDAVNTTGTEQRATLSADGKRLYFGRDGDIFVSERAGKN
jgi:hypothetical protein